MPDADDASRTGAFDPPSRPQRHDWAATPSRGAARGERPTGPGPGRRAADPSATVVSGRLGAPSSQSQGGRSRPVPRRSGGPLTAAMERDLAAGGVDLVDGADPRDDDLIDGRGSAGREPAGRDDAGAESMSFLRRLAVAMVVLAVALGVGVGAGVVWEKVRPSGRTAASGSDQPTSGAASSASPGATATTPPAVAGAGTAATGQIAVPADWVAFTDPQQKASFSHPPVWKLRRDNTGVFYGEPGAKATDYGPQMIGVARIAGSDATAALAKVQAGEFDGVAGLTKERSGAATDTNGQPTQELAGSYDREGQRVSYLMRTISADGAVYVLIARVSTSAAASLNTLMGALRSSFSPVT